MPNNYDVPIRVREGFFEASGAKDAYIIYAASRIAFTSNEFRRRRRRRHRHDRDEYVSACLKRDRTR